MVGPVTATVADFWTQLFHRADLLTVSTDCHTGLCLRVKSSAITVLFWRARPSSSSLHERGGSGKGHTLKCNYQGNLKCIVYHKIFIVLKFSDSMGSAKIKHTIITCIIIANAVRGHLSENYLTRRLITRNFVDTKYYRFTVICCHTHL